MDRRHRPSRKQAMNLLTVGLLVAWWFTLAPTQFGGPASYIEVDGHSMDGTYATGDLIVMRQADTYEKGDVVAYRVGGAKVIHRIIGGNGHAGYVLQGDNNPDPDPWHPTDQDVIGRAVHRFPGSAHLLHLPAQPWFAGLVAGVLTLLMLLPDGVRDRTRPAGAKGPVAGGCVDGPGEVPSPRVPARHEVAPRHAAAVPTPRHGERAVVKESA